MVPSRCVQRTGWDWVPLKQTRLGETGTRLDSGRLRETASRYGNETRKWAQQAPQFRQAEASSGMRGGERVETEELSEGEHGWAGRARRRRGEIP